MKKFDGYVKGVDFGGWLSQCSEYSTEHYNEFITESDFEVVASWGCDHVRLPVDYQVFQNDDGSFIEGRFKYIENAILWAINNNLNLILDLHKTIGYSFDVDASKISFFDDEKLQEHFYALWEEFARRFAKNEDMLSFELLNEVTLPSYNTAWNRIAGEAIKRIRAISPTVKILVGGYWNNSIEAIKDLDKPADENIVYNFHCYDPLLFTHQGARWLKGMPANFRIGYPCEIEKLNEEARKNGMDDYVVRLNGDSGAGTQGRVGAHVQVGTQARKFDKQFFIDRFREGIKICEERDVALYCGEYGVINKANTEDTLQWFKDINAAFKECGIGRACWTYKSHSFGLTDEHMKGVVNEVVKLL